METQQSNWFDLNQGTVTLCGSTRFYAEYDRAFQALTLKGWIVLTCGQFGHSKHKYTVPVNPRISLGEVKKLHLVKIEKSDLIVVIRPDYIGDSTKIELDFATKLNKPIAYFDGDRDLFYFKPDQTPALLENSILDNSIVQTYLSNKDEEFNQSF